MEAVVECCLILGYCILFASSAFSKAFHKGSSRSDDPPLYWVSLSPFFKKGIPLLPWVCHEKKGTNTKENVSIKVFNSLSSVMCARATTIDKERPKGFNQNGIYWLLVNWEKRYCPKKAWNLALVGPPLETIQKASKLPLIFLGGKGSLSARVWVYQLIPNNNRNIKD